MQGFSSELSRTERSHELQISGTLEGRTWAKWTLSLGLFAGLECQSASRKAAHASCSFSTSFSYAVPSNVRTAEKARPDVVKERIP